MQPPVAKRVPLQRTHHGDTFVDEYEWLREKDDSEVVAYLEAENAYTRERTAHLQPLQDAIFAEIKSRTKETDLSVPVRMGEFWYYSRSFEGKQYGVQCRCPITGPDDWTPPDLEADADIPGEQVLLDSNELAEGHEFFSLGAFSVSHDGTLLAYSTDVVGDERYTLRIKDLAYGRGAGRRDPADRARCHLGSRPHAPVLSHRRRLVATRHRVAAQARHDRGRRRAGVPRTRRAVLGRDRIDAGPSAT